MSHSKKICNVALATHIEQCFPEYSYAPLIVNPKVPITPEGAVGLGQLIRADIESAVRVKATPAGAADPAAAAQAFIAAGMDVLNKSLGSDEAPPASVADDLKQEVERLVRVRQNAIMAEAKKAFVKRGGAAVDLDRLDLALDARIDRAVEGVKFDSLAAGKFVPIANMRARRLPYLGMFFSETTCFRSEGMSYPPCGREYSILPNETLTESYVEETSLDTTDTVSIDEMQSLSQKTKQEDSTSLLQSYSDTIKKTTDLNIARKASAKGKLFKVIDIGLESSSSANFNKIIETVSKQSSTITRTLVEEVVSDYKLQFARSSTSKSRLATKYSRGTEMKNTGDEPMHVVERQPHCVYSVIHKRTDVHLAWSGCIDDPGSDLCRPDNIEQKHAAQIQAIRDKWSVAVAPGSFGPRPANEHMCTGQAGADDMGVFGADNVTFNLAISTSIPSGYSYVAGSASITVLDSDTDVTSTAITSEPGSGASGQLSFGAQVIVNNKAFNRESVSIKICFYAAPPSAAQWDAAVNAWREQQAQIEIDQLIATEITELNEFLLSDRVNAVIEQRILKEFFGVENIHDCCNLIRTIRSVFDFNLLSFALLPSWNDIGSGCQTTEPVTIYTARCLQFYLPVVAGKEWEAIAMLMAINVVPNDSQLLAAVAGYISSIVDMRNTLFDRAFDPSGWDVKIDGPTGYLLTPYDTSDAQWASAFESSLNYQLIDVNVVTVPVGGPRKEIRPNIC